MSLRLITRSLLLLSLISSLSAFPTAKPPAPPVEFARVELPAVTYPQMAYIEIDADKAGYASHCSGAVIKKDTVLTAAHCFSGEKHRIGMTFDQGLTWHRANVLYVGDPASANDFMVLQVDTGNIPPLPLKVLVIHPTPMRMVLTSRSNKPRALPAFYFSTEVRDSFGGLEDQYMADIKPGDSGSPVIDEEGNVVGMVISVLELDHSRIAGVVPTANILKALPWLR